MGYWGNLNFIEEGTALEMLEPGQITLLLRRLKAGEHAAESELMDLVYGQLLRMARRLFQNENPGHTLQPSALVSELYLRLIRDSSIDWQNGAHLFALAAQNMRRILVDHARALHAQKSPPPRGRLSLDDVFLYSEAQSAELLALNEALDRLTQWDARQAKIVELRFFGGLSVEETAVALNVAARTVKRDWAMARAWLSNELGGEPQVNAATPGR